MAAAVLVALGPTYVPPTHSRSGGSLLKTWPPNTMRGCGAALTGLLPPDGDVVRVSDREIVGVPTITDLHEQRFE